MVPFRGINCTAQDRLVSQLARGGAPPTGCATVLVGDSIAKGSHGGLLCLHRGQVCAIRVESVEKKRAKQCLSRKTLGLFFFLLQGSLLDYA